MGLVLLAPMATAMRHLMSICDIFATDFDNIFNTQKSKCIFFDSAVSHLSCLLPTFYVGKSVIMMILEDSFQHSIFFV